MTSPFRLEPLADAHDRASFQCGVAHFDRYFREQATQDIRPRMSRCFVAAERENGDVAGFYTLAAANVQGVELPPEITKRLPRYQAVPAALVGRLAVDLRYRERGVGSALLGDAVRRTARADPAAFTLLVDVKDETAAAFYRKHGFAALAGKPLTLFFPPATALKLFT